MPNFPQKAVGQLTERNLMILRDLARYRYLTSSQMVDLGIAQQRAGLYQILRRFGLFRAPVVERSNFSRVRSDQRGQEKLESVFYLTERGMALLREIDPDHETDKNPIKTKAIAMRDYDHRRETVDFHILVDQFAALYGCTVDCFHVYFDHTGANNSAEGSGIELLRRNTTIQFDAIDVDGVVVEQGKKFSPDAIFHLTDPSDKGHLYAVEIQRGMDTKRLVNKLKHEYIPALACGAISDAYGVNRPALVLIVCENESLMLHALERMNDDPYFEGFEGCFAFNTIAALGLYA